jgi:hypothetical protein
LTKDDVIYSSTGSTENKLHLGNIGKLREFMCHVGISEEKKVTTLVTDRVPELSYPFIVTGLADAVPAISALVMEKTPLANSIDALADVGTAALGEDGDAGLVGLALQPLQTKPSYVVRVELQGQYPQRHLRL